MAGAEAAANDQDIHAVESKARPAGCRCPPTKQTRERAAPACECHTNSKDVRDVWEYPTPYRAYVSLVQRIREGGGIPARKRAGGRSAASPRARGRSGR